MLKKNTLIKIMFIFTFFGIVGKTVAQDKEDNKKEVSEHVFTMKKQLPATTVKDQYRSGTCWSYSSLSFIESELLRTGKGEFDLSEMFVVRQTYVEKAIKYVRMHGNLNFGGGGAFHDAINVIDKYGIVPETVFDGNKMGEVGPVHGEMDIVLKNYLDGVIKNKNRKLSKVWLKGFEGILSAYLGELPEKFEYNGKEYTPLSFAEELNINIEDYVEISSYLHHPFYESFIIEIPDNWAYGKVYNVPLKEMVEVMDNAIMQGYSIAWGGDVSEEGFSWKKGLAVVPEKEKSDLDGLEKAKWSKLSKKEIESLVFGSEAKEKDISPELRQIAFDNYKTTDDHGVHIVGIANNQGGKKFYYIKNSWNKIEHKYDGYFYASENFIKYKTMNFMIHKDALPKKTKKRLGL
ncbi:MAG: aminopeptidase [Bacteroidetes bacterium]|jgi:bleomycin hydrolase|nr:aminopeptidase [Bacteroidota bacterium]MBT6687175.1 aminopeptidase [Bacteroidota bacterium]MBT7144935.1 aminopeptidase [Bacteroidota bacterium]MBT7492974.1 aminopeptidase [Bacteroidota bacterium]